MSGRVRDKAARLDWPAILERAAEIVNSYDTGVTLRQLFYRLVAAQVLPNTQTVYRRLSARTAEARRAGTFPALVDATRGIVRPRSFDGPEQAREWLASIYRRDRTEGQEQTIYLGVEKQGLVALLQSWYWDMGLPIVALKGYGSQTYLDEIGEDVERQGRPAVMLYAGDFDPTGEDIERDLGKRCPALDVRRIALTEDQVREHGLPENPAKAGDSRGAGFKARHGKLVQVEVDALPPDVLRDLFDAAMAGEWDKSQWERSVKREDRERTKLEDTATE